MMFPKGHEFTGPDGQGYRLKTDFNTASGNAEANAFEPFGGAPEPVMHAIMPEWLVSQIDAALHRDKHTILDL